MDDENKELKNYTRLFNPILEALYKSDLSGAEFQIVLCVIRATYGWKQKKHPMSTSLIASRTGLNERTVRRLVKLLIEKNYLINFGLDKSKKCNVLGLNKKYSQWNCVMGSNDPGGEMTLGENCNQRGVKSVD